MRRETVITKAKGNLLNADVDALVNTVNTVGVMGKGIALQFRRAYPKMFKAYSQAVKRGEVKLGYMHVWPTEQFSGPRYIINFPTKADWRSMSKLPDIERGLDDLVTVITDLGITSIAVPPLGCGAGGLSWRDVEPLIHRKLESLSNVRVALFEPGGAPAAADMPNAEPTPKMTPGRAALIWLMTRYEQYALAMPSLIEVQKLMYLLQVAGEPLQLNFGKHLYGPYADNLRHVLRVVEGHYVSGYGDGASPVREAEPLSVLPGALEAARPVLDVNPESMQRVERVLELADGFESAYGLELLASVHWVMTENSAAVDDPDVAVQAVRGWTQRKGRLFTDEHIRTAWRTLRERGWSPALVDAS